MGVAVVDSEIEIEVGAKVRTGEYAVRVVRATGGGEPRGTLRLDVDAVLSRRAQLETSVLASSARSRGGLVPAAELPLRQTGQELFEALFSGAVREVYRASLAVARDRSARLRVVLRLVAPELSLLPWEAMWDPELEAYVCRKEPLVRHVPAPFTAEPLPVKPPLRILGLVASPRGLAMLDVQAEQQHLNAALASAIAQGRAVLEWLPEASWDGLHERLLNERWHVLHFIGHGEYDQDTDQGRIALVGGDGRADWVDAERLADLLDQAQPTPRLVVLNSCSSGQGGTRDLFSGTAAALVHSGISAVAAMQFSVSDHAAVVFPRGFYTALATGRSVDEAVRSGRISILGARHSLEWVTPVLYVRGDATRMFTLTDHPKPAQTPPEDPRHGQDTRMDDHGKPARPPGGTSDITTDPLYFAALEAFSAERWEQAVDLFTRVANRYQPDPRVTDRLAHARRQQQLARLDTLAVQAAAEDRWGDAVEALEQITAVDPGYRDVGSRLETARVQRRIADLQADLRALHGAGQWVAVVTASEELARLDPAAADPEGMVTDAQARLTEADLAAQYATGLRQLDQGAWTHAATTFQALLRNRPKYRDAATLLAQALNHGQPAVPATPVSVPEPRILRVGQSVQAVAWSPDGSRLATGGRNRLRLWDLRAGAQVWEQAVALSSSVVDVAFSPDGTRLATASGQAARIWDAATGEEQLQLSHSYLSYLSSGVCAVAFSPDGTRLATVTFETRALIWDAATGAKQLQLTSSQYLSTYLAMVKAAAGGAAAARFCAVAFSPDGTRLATTTGETARIWDAATGEEQLQLTHPRQVGALAFSPDGTRLATGGHDKTARIWDAVSGKLQIKLTHPGGVQAVAFSPDGTRLATASSDQRARIWDVTSGTEQRQLTHAGLVWAVAFSPDGTRLATGSKDKTARIWDVTLPPK